MCMDGVMWRCVGVDVHGWCDVGGVWGLMGMDGVMWGGVWRCDVGGVWRCDVEVRRVLIFSSLSAHHRGEVVPCHFWSMCAHVFFQPSPTYLSSRPDNIWCVYWLRAPCSAQRSVLTSAYNHYLTSLW